MRGRRGIKAARAAVPLVTPAEVRGGNPSAHRLLGAARPTGATGLRPRATGADRADARSAWGLLARALILPVFAAGTGEGEGSGR